METDGAVALFSHSREKYNLIYNKYMGNSDSKSYSAVTKAMPYGRSNKANGKSLKENSSFL